MTTKSAKLAWYHLNKGRINANKRARYAGDLQHRLSVIASILAARDRMLEGTEYKFTTDMLHRNHGISPPRVLSWVRQGYIPQPRILGGRQVFTERQKRLLCELNTLLDHDCSRNHLDTYLMCLHVNW